MERRRYKISYIKKPLAKKSYVCFGLAAVALICGFISLRISVALQGAGGANVGAWGLSSLLFTCASLTYGGLSFQEEEKNYILSKIGIGASGLLLIFWLCMLAVGIFA